MPRRTNTEKEKRIAARVNLLRTQLNELQAWTKGFDDRLYKLQAKINKIVRVSRAEYDDIVYQQSRRDHVCWLRSHGLTYAEIGRRMGFSTDRARTIFVTQERRQKYRLLIDSQNKGKIPNITNNGSQA